MGSFSTAGRGRTLSPPAALSAMPFVPLIKARKGSKKDPRSDGQFAAAAAAAACNTCWRAGARELNGRVRLAAAAVKANANEVDHCCSLTNYYMYVLHIIHLRERERDMQRVVLAILLIALPRSFVALQHLRPNM